MQRFDLTIELGNAEMRDRKHVALALRKVAMRLDLDEDTGRIQDPNGNTVGHFGFDAVLGDAYEVREKTDAENAFDAAIYNAAKAVVEGKPVSAREWLDVARAARGIDGLDATIRKIDLQDGDTLIVETDRKLTAQMHQELCGHLDEHLDANVKTLIFDGMHVAGVIEGDRLERERAFPGAGYADIPEAVLERARRAGDHERADLLAPYRKPIR